MRACRSLITHDLQCLLPSTTRAFQAISLGYFSLGQQRKVTWAPAGARNARCVSGNLAISPKQKPRPLDDSLRSPLRGRPPDVLHASRLSGLRRSASQQRSWSMTTYKVTRSPAGAQNARRAGGKLTTTHSSAQTKNHHYSCAAAYAFNFTNIAANPFDRVGERCFASPIV
jgi:hypothetical protein